MAHNYWRLKTARFTAAGDEVLVLNENSAINELNIMVEVGTVEIEGDTNAPNNVFGSVITESPIIVGAQQSFSLNEIQYKEVTVTIKAGATVQLTANI
jgi:hypothetical protein